MNDEPAPGIHEELREHVANLAVEVGSPLALARRLGVHHVTVYRYLKGEARLGLVLGRALVRAYPELREQVSAVLLPNSAGAALVAVGAGGG